MPGLRIYFLRFYFILFYFILIKCESSKLIKRRVSQFNHNESHNPTTIEGLSIIEGYGVGDGLQSYNFLIRSYN
jgi:hypothetical protein